MVLDSKGGRNLGRFDTKNAGKAGSAVRATAQKIFIKVRDKKRFTTSEKCRKTKERGETEKEARWDFTRVWTRGETDAAWDYCTALYCDFSGWH